MRVPRRADVRALRQAWPRRALSQAALAMTEARLGAMKEPMPAKSITDHVRKRLWARRTTSARFRHATNDCRRRPVTPATATIVGKERHILAPKDDPSVGGAPSPTTDGRASGRRRTMARSS